MEYQTNTYDKDLFYRYEMRYGVNFNGTQMIYLLQMNLWCNMNLACVNDYIDVYRVSDRQKYHSSYVSENMELCFEVKEEDLGQEFELVFSQSQIVSEKSNSESDSESESDIYDENARGEINFSILFKVPMISLSHSCLLCSQYIDNTTDLYITKFGNAFHHSCISKK